MKYSKSSYRYAKALIDLAKEKNLLEDIHKDITLINKLYSKNLDLKSAFDSSIIKLDTKKEIAKSIFAKNIHKVSLNFILLIIDKNRSHQIFEITSRFLNLYNELKSLSVATVTTAVPLNKNLKEAISKKAAEILGKTVEVVNIIDKTIIGGFILKVGDLQYNVSISNKIKNMKKEFNNNLYLCKY